MQAAAALLIHAAHRQPLLPVAPHAMAAMVLLPTPRDFFGNAVRMLSVSLPAGTQQRAERDALGALRALAGGIRQATLRFRSDKVGEEGWGSAGDIACLSQQAAATPCTMYCALIKPPWRSHTLWPVAGGGGARTCRGAVTGGHPRAAHAVPRVLPGAAPHAVGHQLRAGEGWLVECCSSAVAQPQQCCLLHREAPSLWKRAASMHGQAACCIINAAKFTHLHLHPPVHRAAPQVQQGLELWGLGTATHTHPLSWPRAADMAVIRPSAAPFTPGLFFQFVLPPAAMARLRALPLLPALLPTARWVGANNGSG